MESKFDIVTTASAVGVAAYVAIATGYVARYHLGLSLHGVRSGAVAIAVVIGALLVIDFFGKKLGKAK
jgi:4-hydroxy-3-methylbut-2-en-1-yl diphosphate synthase IspG/GcpE